MTLQRKNTFQDLSILDKDDIIEFQLPKWNSPSSFQRAWNFVLIQVQGNPSIIDNTTIDERHRLFETLRQLKKSYYSYPLANHTSVLITSHQKPLIRVHLNQNSILQNWAKVDIDNIPQIDTTNYAKAVNYCFYGGIFITMCIWSLVFHMV